MTPTLPPPALSAMPQFTLAYWDKAPREMNRAKLTRITSKIVDNEEGYGYTEFVFENGNAFLRKNTELNAEMFAKLHVNMQVFVQTYQGELVTGLFIPENGWVFQMTSQDLVDFAQKTVNDVNRKRLQAKAQLTDFLGDTLVKGLEKQGTVDGEIDGVTFHARVDFPIDIDLLAQHIVHALEHAKAPQ